nr:hypothetical protein [Candidatus Njordarchaeota archaeon]
MGIVRICIVVDSNKNALCYELRREMDQREEVRKNRWDIAPEGQKAETCSKCPLAWNNGSCEGRFGPTYSSLPNFAKRFGLELIAGIPKAYEEHRIYSSSDAQKLLEELALMREKLKFEKDTVFIPKEQESLPDEKIEQWLMYTVGFDGVMTRKLSALRVHEATLTQLENMAKTCVKYGCGFFFP